VILGQLSIHSWTMLRYVEVKQKKVSWLSSMITGITIQSILNVEITNQLA